MGELSRIKEGGGRRVEPVHHHFTPGNHQPYTTKPVNHFFNCFFKQLCRTSYTQLKMLSTRLVLVICLLVGAVSPATHNFVTPLLNRERRSPQRRFFNNNDVADGLAGAAGGFATSYFLNQLACRGRRRNQGNRRRNGSKNRSFQSATIGAGVGFALGSLFGGC